MIHAPRGRGQPPDGAQWGVVRRFPIGPCGERVLHRAGRRPARALLGTDFPYEDGEVFVRAVSYVSESGLPPRDAAAILGTNAAALLGRPANRAAA